ncbi:TRAF-like family protein [Corchorus olitorius]|uniref:TRAF-like family protein n=1 Tax=Corchorus olitorius TaxID=93759 RepID=A0A1R3KPX9_9ROSI|nr:TRAF-like family protein [Corchorus olitorius]
MKKSRIMSESEQDDFNGPADGNNNSLLFLSFAPAIASNIIYSSCFCGWEVLAKFEFFILDQLRGNYLNIKESETRRCFQPTKTEWGLAKLLSLEIFNDLSNGYLVDDCCILGAEVYVTKSTGRMECFSLVDTPDRNSYTWDIENFSTLGPSRYESKHFIVQGTTWRIDIYPKGTSKSRGGLAAFLSWVKNGGQDSDDEVYAVYEFRIKDRLGNILQGYTDTAKHKFCSSSQSFGWPEFISRKDLEDNSKNFLVEDRLILEAEIISMSVTKSLP